MFKNPQHLIIRWIAVVFSLYTLYFNIIGVIPGIVLRAGHLMFSSILIFYLWPISKKFPHKLGLVINSILIIGSLMQGFYIINKYSNLDSIQHSLGTPSSLDKIMAVIAIVVVLEMARRTSGWGIVGITMLFIFYAYFGFRLPGYWAHKTPSIGRLLSHLYLSLEGIYGFLLGVSATFVSLFILFSSFIQKSYAQKFLVDLSFYLTRRLRGGPAQAAIIGSAFMGSVNGSATANVVGTGSITIPLMKKIGFKPHIAAAIETAASTGGGIMPPMLGIAAFIMVEWLGIPYFNIVKISIVPAIIYFTSVIASVHFKSCKENIKVKDRFSNLGRIVKEGVHFTIPIFVIIYFLWEGYTPSLAAFSGIISLIVVSWFRKHSRMRVRDVLSALEIGARNIVTIASCMACIGIVVGCIDLTGIGLKFSNVLASMAGNNLLLAIIFVSFASLILGMGLPITAAYVTIVIFSSTALKNLGLPLIVSHMVIFWFSQISAITPPVCITSYVAAGIANANPTKTAINAWNFAKGLYIIPFLFVYTPLITGNFYEILRVGFFAILGMIAFSSCTEKYLLQKLNLIEIVLMGISALLLLFPNFIGNLIGFLLFTIIILRQYYLKIKNTKSNERQESSISLAE